jgi:hypothetical protein
MLGTCARTSGLSATVRAAAGKSAEGVAGRAGKERGCGVGPNHDLCITSVSPGIEP